MEEKQWGYYLSSLESNQKFEFSLNKVLTPLKELEKEKFKHALVKILLWTYVWIGKHFEVLLGTFWNQVTFR